MNQQLRLILFILLALAALAYLGGIIWAGVASLQEETEPVLPDIVAMVITVIGGVLATHTGAVFGIARYEGGSSKAPVAKPQNWSQLPSRGRAKDEGLLNTTQLAAVYVYVISLVLAVVFWGIDGFSADSAEIIRNMSVTLVGLFGGIAAVALNVDNAG